MNSAAKVLLDTQCAHGEGPVWDSEGNRLLWVDLTGCKIHSLKPATQEFETRKFDEPVCAVAPVAKGRLLVAFAKRLAWLDLETSTTQTICEVEPELPGNRCNDGKMDPAGRFWIGTMSNDGSKQGAGSLYRLDKGKSLVRVLVNLTISNGMDWTADGRTMFFIDSVAHEVWAFDFDPADSSISNRRTVVRVPGDLGLPDGMTLGVDGTLWVAHWGPGCVCQWDPVSGRLLQRINTGCPHTTSCCFGSGGELFITTSRLGLNDEALSAAPYSGGLYYYPNLNEEP